MDAMFKTQHMEVFALRNTIGHMERQRREDTARWQLQLMQKDHELCLLRKALRDMARQKKAFDIQKEEWRREKECMRENLEKTEMWGAAVLDYKSKEIALLHEKVQQLREETAKISEERHEMERELKVKYSRMEELCQIVQTNIEIQLSSIIAGREAPSEEKELKVLMKCQDSMKMLNSFMVTLQHYDENQKQEAVKHREVETQTLCEQAVMTKDPDTEVLQQEPREEERISMDQTNQTEEGAQVSKRRRGFKRFFFWRKDSGLKEPKDA